MYVSVFWCLPGVQSALRLHKRCVGDNKSISFTNDSEHLTSLISPSKSTWSNSALIWLFFSHTFPDPHYGGVCCTFSTLFKNLFGYTMQFFHFVTFILWCWHIHLHYQNTYQFCMSLDSKYSVIIYSLLNTSHSAFMHHCCFPLFSPFTCRIIQWALLISPCHFYHTSLTPRIDTAFCIFFPSSFQCFLAWFKVLKFQVPVL